jgi:hypothetical protein
MRWKSVPGYEGYYEVSEYGDLRSLDRLVTRIRNGKETRPFFLKGRDLKLAFTRKGYAHTSLFRDGLGEQVWVHRIVASVFLPRPKKYQIWVCHKDDDPRNRHYKNLFWGEPQDNSSDMCTKERQCRGEQVNSAILTEREVKKIIRLQSKNVPCKTIKSMFGIKNRQVVDYIARGLTWKHLPRY